MKLAVVGAGWAGLAAAVQATDLGHDVHVWEAAHTLGGRARSVHAPTLNRLIDNGQHLMLGAYDQSLALMRRLGVDENQALLRQPLRLESADGEFRLQLARLPAPWHLLSALAGARGLSWREKWRLAVCLHQLQGAQWQTPPSMTLQEWLQSQRQGPRIQALFWHPLCLAAMNTPAPQACAQLFANVLRDSLGAGPRACDMLLSRTDLSRLWPARVPDMHPHHPEGRLRLRPGETARELELSGRQGLSLNGEGYDAAILACGPDSVRRLLGAQLTAPDRSDAAAHLDAALTGFEHRPIATLTLQLAASWPLAQAMYMLRENRASREFGQWLFYTPLYQHENGAQAPLVHVVISDAEAALAGGREALRCSIEAQISRQTTRFGPMPAITGHALIVEKKATFAALPGLRRPGVETPWPTLWLAGDWTDTAYPAVLEGAVRSGRQAATRLHRAAGLQACPAM